MDLQSTQTIKEKRSTLSKVVVVFCLMLTAALLISSLVSAGKAHANLTSSGSLLSEAL